MEPLISVIIPNYNREHVIVDTVQSVLEQTYANLEVIVVDDGSSDASAEELKKIKDSRFRFVLSEAHRGANACRNEGAQLSKGEYIAFQDSGTIWHADKLEKQLARLRQSPEAGLVYCIVRARDGSRTICYPEESMERSRKEEGCRESLAVRNLIDTPSIMVTRDCFEKTGGFDENLKRWQDYDFVIRVSQTYSIVIVNEILVETFYYANSISKDFSFLAEALPEFLRKNKEFFTCYGTWEEIVKSVIYETYYSQITGVDFLKFCNQLDSRLREIFPEIDFWKLAGQIIGPVIERGWYDVPLAEYNFRSFIQSVHMGQHFVIYGAGKIAGSLLELFEEAGCRNRIETFIVTKTDSKSALAGIPVISVEEFQKRKDALETPVLIGTAERMQLEIFQSLSEREFKNIYLLHSNLWRYIK